ncbi:hypothetical protein [Acinetobacter sp. NCu2D-2]|uniref:hypothetical protein n=1 Tax=Acinetobacter sp. NCu2D-2 TaxID=1608473 RepID=UPI0009D65253|nr:hypothetical protein [Acinetobacter sp. NCu2D-2]
MTKLSMLMATVLSTVLVVACAKQDEAQNTESEASSAVVEEISPEQQAAIDAIDKPILDEKNTDVPNEVANAPADAATPDLAASEATPR